MKERLKKLLEEYGPVALGVYYALFALVLGGCFIALRTGLMTGSGAAGNASTLGVAYIMTKLAMPIRLPIALALTPLVARLIRRKPKAIEPPPPEQEPGSG